MEVQLKYRVQKPTLIEVPFHPRALPLSMSVYLFVLLYFGEGGPLACMAFLMLVPYET